MKPCKLQVTLGPKLAVGICHHLHRKATCLLLKATRLLLKGTHLHLHQRAMLLHLHQRAMLLHPKAMLGAMLQPKGMHLHLKGMQFQTMTHHLPHQKATCLLKEIQMRLLHLLKAATCLHQKVTWP